jgi:hypothetical protein
MASKDIRDKIIELLRYSWYSAVNDAWTYPYVKGYKWVPKVIFLTTMPNKDAIVIDEVDDRLLDALKRHIVYCTPDVPMRYSITCDKIVDKIPGDVFVIALPP